MANPVEIPVKTQYDDKGFKQLQADAVKADKQARRLGRLQTRLNQSVIRETSQRRRIQERLNRAVAQEAKQIERQEKALKRAAAARRAQAREVASGLAAGLTVIAAFTAETVRAADEARKTEQAFFGLSGGAEAAAQNLAAMDRATRGLASEQEQQAIANQLLGMGIVSTSEEMERVVGVSRRLGKEFKGIGAADAAEEFAIMNANMSFQRLDSFGISSAKVRDRIKELQATTEGMTREQAFFIASLEEGEKILAKLGPELEGPTEKVQRLQAAFTDMKVSVGEVILALGDAGLIDTLTDVVNALDEGAKAWRGAIQEVNRLTEAVNRANEAQGRFQDAPQTGFQAMEQQFGALAVSQEELAENYTAIVQEEKAAEKAADDLAMATVRSQKATEASSEANQEEEKRLESVSKIRRKAAEDLVNIQARAQEDALAAGKRFREDSERAETTHSKRMANIRQGRSKALAKSQTDESRSIKRLQDDAAKEGRRKERSRQIDAAGDERLFQLDLRNLAAEGNAIAIEQALERREIEQQIAEEKVGAEDQIEADRSQTQIDRLKEDAATRRDELKADAAEALANEKDNFVERLAGLEQFRVERLASIETTKQEAIRKLGEQLAQEKDLTQVELGELVVIAGRMGQRIGANLADGIAAGFAQNQQISNLLGGISAGGSSGGGAPSLSPLQRIQGVQFGGSFVVGGSGGPDSQLVGLRATPGEIITATPPGQQGGQNITINASGTGIDQLVAILEGKVNEGLQEYTDQVLAPALGGS